MVTSPAEVVSAIVGGEEVVEVEGEMEGLGEVDGEVRASPHTCKQLMAIRLQGFLVVQTMALCRLWLRSNLGHHRTVISRSNKVTANSSRTTSTPDEVVEEEVDGVVEVDEGVVVIVDDTNVLH